MSTDNRFFSLPYQFDFEKLTRDLAVCEAEQWTAHFNQKDYDGTWNGIALRSATGDHTHILATADVQYKNTPLLLQCPYFQEIVEMMKCPIESVRLLALAPGSEIKNHRDQGLGYQYGCFRLHIPILTDDGVDFMVDDEKMNMQPGTLWYANFDLPHSVTHRGTTRRIHLVIDGRRNEWTDELFKKAGYDFSLENQQKVYDHQTIHQMLEHLYLMNSDAARTLIAQLEQQLTEKKTPDRPQVPVAPVLSEWLPVKILANNTPPLCQWFYFDETQFMEPFYYETLTKISHLPPNKYPMAALSSLDFLAAAASSFDSLVPGAFIFHVSRCGSTLMSQMLSTEQDFIAVSEPPLLDDILRLKYREPAIEQEEIDRAFMAAVDALGRKRKGSEQYFVVKLDSWHLFFYETIRRLYPATPFILMYRLPHEVFHSQQKQKGVHAIPGYLEKEMIGFGASPTSDWATYLSSLLGRYYDTMANIAAADRNTHLLNYQEGPVRMITVLEASLKIKFSESILEKMMKRSHFHSKSRVQRFAESAAPLVDPVLLEAAVKGYDRMEALLNMKCEV